MLHFQIQHKQRSGALTPRSEGSPVCDGEIVVSDDRRRFGFALATSGLNLFDWRLRARFETRLRAGEVATPIGGWRRLKQGR